MRQILSVVMLLLLAAFTLVRFDGGALSAGDKDKKEAKDKKDGKDKEPKDTRPLSHDVFFTLKDRSPEARKKLVAACRKHLSGHPGEAFFAVGARAESYKREVNDQDFDVALHIVFRDSSFHDLYQDAPRHKTFIKENEANWSKVRVFDSFVDRP